MPLVTRTGKGSKLTTAEMDGNLTYLEGLATPRMLVNTLINKETVDIVDAEEGTSIPDGSTDEYQKTIPLSFTNPTLLYVSVIHTDVNTSMGISPIDLGISSTSAYFLSAYSAGDANSKLRFIVTTDYTTARLSGVISDTFVRDESNNTAAALMIEAPTYIQNNGTLFGIYSGTGFGVGYTSTSVSNLQSNSVIKSMYINNDGNLVLLLKKRSSTTSATWTRLKLNVYNIS